MIDKNAVRLAAASRKPASRSMARPQHATRLPPRQDPGLGFVAGAIPGRMQAAPGPLFS